MLSRILSIVGEDIDDDTVVIVTIDEHLFTNMTII